MMGSQTKILKLCGNQISKPLAFIFNKFIIMGVFPERLKYATVIPLHKKGDVPNMANYRPVSLLPVFSKVFEKAKYCRLNQHLHTTIKHILCNAELKNKIKGKFRFLYPIQ